MPVPNSLRSQQVTLLSAAQFWFLLLIIFQVERMARECFFFLRESFMFDEATLGWFSDTSRYPRGLQVSAPVVYILTMHRPTVAQFGDYAAELRTALGRD
jgi:hypothetical protein